MDKLKRARQIADRLETAVYYGFNLRCSLFESLDADLDAIERILTHAENELKRVQSK